MRIGIGYDAHKLVEGRKLILGGVDIEFEKGLLGHSDADVLTHAVMDALVGAAGLGDIGRHFPNTDMKYKGISSLKLLALVNKLLLENGYKINNIDATVIAEKPRLTPFVDKMSQNIAETLQIENARVNVKSKSEEGLGFTGTGQGIKAVAVSLLIRS
jgi:2-C-methyl-D-erythritol 2,4-cyclodiphosphate synthase